jgi:hypothetical protein
MDRLELAELLYARSYRVQESAKANKNELTKIALLGGDFFLMFFSGHGLIMQQVKSLV